MGSKIRFLRDFIGHTHGQIEDAPTSQMKRWATTKAKHQSRQICCFVGDPEDIYSKNEEEAKAKAKEAEEEAKAKEGRGGEEAEAKEEEDKKSTKSAAKRIGVENPRRHNRN